MALAGNRAAEEGPTSTVFMAHAKLHKERKTPLMILENVKAGCGEDDFIPIHNNNSQDRSFHKPWEFKGGPLNATLPAKCTIIMAGQPSLPKRTPTPAEIRPY